MRKDFVCLVARGFFAFAFLFAISGQLARAQSTINVPADQPTIQAAINAANNGDTVLVAPGTYFENLNFNGKAITVTSSDGPAVTIVDGNAAAPVATFQTNEGASSVLNGFTLQNGVPSQAFPISGESGGGILVLNASPTVTGNVITGNHAICGIGIEVRNGSPLIRGNTITNNTQSGGTGGCGGGGIEVTGDFSHPVAAPIITGNTITNNSLLGGGNGGGIAAEFFASPTIQNNYIAGNAVFNSGGGILVQSSGTPVVVQNIIVNNSAGGGGSGGGIALSSPAPVINNTIVDNNAFDRSSGIFTQTATTTISNNIVVAAPGQTGIECSQFGSTFPTFLHNDVLSPGGGQTWSSNCASFASINGNISADPQFVNASANDFHLLAGSPAIDAGGNTVPDLPQQDYDGNARVAIGNATNSIPTVDMGVYEIALAGTPAAALSPTSLSFADQAVNTSSVARTVTLFNTGANPLTILGVSVSGDFTQSNTCPSTLDIGSSCAIQVTFAPTLLGARGGTLTVSSSSVPAAPTVLLSGTGVQPGTPVTINVPDNQPTIQAAIDAANNGDTVLVAPGTYFENLNFEGKAITVTSSGGPWVTIVDGGGLGPVVTFKTNEGSNSVLNGFRLQNGVPAQFFPISGVSGGGILIMDASPTITGNVIAGNHAINGIGIEIEGGSAVIRGNTITANTQAFGDGGRGGAGIEVNPGSTSSVTPQIIGNTITNNSLDGGGSGGGIGVFGTSPIIRNNYIAGNSVWNDGGGIDLEEGGAPVVADNIIFNNTTLGGGSGAGIFLQGVSSSTSVVINNTIVGNNAFDGSSGIYSDSLGFLISNNIVVAASGQNGIVCSPFNSTFPTFTHNDVTITGTGGQAWSSNCAGFASANGNISFDPQFVNATANDFHLLAGSPAIDAGDNTVPDLPQQDFDGNPRVAVGNVTNGSDTVDMGVYEFVPTGTPVATLSPTSLSFADQLVNTASAVQTVTLSNIGTAPVTIAAISVSGDFTQSNTCPAALAVGSTCTIQVTFTPTATGVRNGSLSISSNSAPPAPAIALTGNGVQPGISVSPAAVNFADQLINTTAPSQTITIKDFGTAPLHIAATLVSGDPDLSVIVNNCTLAVPPSESCTLEVGFAPRAAGPGAATLSIISDAPGLPTTVTLSGKGIDPIGSLSPSSLNFGNQLVNTTSAAQTVTLSNTGTDPLTISGISVSGDFTQSNTCTATLAVSSSCAIQITFTPTATGTRSGSLSISSNSAAPAPAIALTGTGIQPAISVSPASIAFGNQSINTEAPAQTISVTNPGTATLHINSLVVSGDADFFTSNNDCVAGTGVVPGGSCSIQVEFFPHSTGPGSATLTIGSDAASGPVSVSLSGTGVNPVIATVSPSVLDFGNRAVGTQSPTQIISLTNTGTGVMTVSGVTITGDPDFILVDNGCAGGFAAGITCSIQIAFAPKSLGAGSATLTITSNASNNPVSVALSGTGVTPPAASVSPASINFGSVSVGTQNNTPIVTVSNTGGAPLDVNSLTMSGDSDFFVSLNNCSGAVAPGGSCTIQMEFRPLSAGPGSATLTIGSNASNGAISVSLSGTGVNPAMVSVSPAAINFGNQAVGTASAPQTVSISNTGTVSLHINALTISGDPDFATLNNSCPLTAGIPPGTRCSVQVVFGPRSLGPGSATLTITSDAANNPVSVSLSGTGVNPPKASISPASLSFGSLLPGTESAPQTITVSNIGGATLLINSQLVTGDSDFFVSNSNCVGGPGVAPGSSCSIQVVFFPHSGGPGSATLTVGSNDPAAPQQSVSLAGTGIDYAIAAPASLSVRSGDKVQPTITISAVGGNFSNAVSLSCSGLPSGASCSFSPSSVVPGATSATSRLTINTQQSGGIKTPLGTYTIIVNGSSGSSVHSAPITLTVTN